MYSPRVLLFLLCLVWTCSGSWAQTLHLGKKATGATWVEAEIGEIIEIEVLADLGRFSASGISFFISLPRGPLEVVDSGFEGRGGVQPFLQGPLFKGAMEASNTLVPEEKMPDLLKGRQMLTYDAVLGPGNGRGRNGTGVVARFRLHCVEAVAHAEILIDSSPIYETRLVLSDGQSERRFQVIQGMTITAESSNTLVEEMGTWGRIKAGFKP